MSIVVCLPGGGASDVLVAAGAEHARRAQQPLVLLHHVKLRDLELAADVDREVGAVDQVRSELEALAAGIDDVSARVELLTSGADNPSPELLTAITDADAELLVIGLRSRSRVGKFLLGSTAQDLLLGAGRPVLCVPV